MMEAIPKRMATDAINDPSNVRKDFFRNGMAVLPPPILLLEDSAGISIYEIHV